MVRISTYQGKCRISYLSVFCVFFPTFIQYFKRDPPIFVIFLKYTAVFSLTILRYYVLKFPLIRCKRLNSLTTNWHIYTITQRYFKSVKLLSLNISEYLYKEFSAIWSKNRAGRGLGKGGGGGKLVCAWDWLPE